MARPKLQLLPRLLSKIEIDGVDDARWLAEFVGQELPPEVSEPEWRWVGATAARCIIKQWQKRADGSRAFYLYNRPPMPAFNVDGKRVIVHRLIYKLFRGITPSLRYHKSPVNYLDVNPSHWVTRDALTPRKEEVHQFDPDMAGLIDLMHERIAIGRPLLENLHESYTQEQIDAALTVVNPPNLHKFLTPTQEGSYVLASPEESRR